MTNKYPTKLETRKTFCGGWTTKVLDTKRNVIHETLINYHSPAAAREEAQEWINEHQSIVGLFFIEWQTEE